MENWAAKDVKMISTKSLIPYARNSRTHNDEQVAQIAASITEWGFTNPILKDEDNNILAGHGRLLAAQKLKLAKVPCITAKGWTEAQKKAYVIADNKLALNAGWDESLLKIEIKELAENFKFNVDLTGFSVDELSELFFDPNFDAGSEDEQGQLDELDPKMITCPHCNKEFDMRGNE